MLARNEYIGKLQDDGQIGAKLFRHFTYFNIYIFDIIYFI